MMIQLWDRFDQDVPGLRSLQHPLNQQQQQQQQQEDESRRAPLLPSHGNMGNVGPCGRQEASFKTTKSASTGHYRTAMYQSKSRTKSRTKFQSRVFGYGRDRAGYHVLATSESRRCWTEPWTIHQKMKFARFLLKEMKFVESARSSWRAMQSGLDALFARITSINLPALMNLEAL